MIRGLLSRLSLGEKRTLGSFELSDNEGKIVWQCYVCEDAVRGDGDPKTVAQWKVKGESAIPYGIYRVRKTQSPKYGRPMWELQNVPGFQGIRIHSGNTEADTEGCLLFGKKVSGDGKSVTDSKACIHEFESLMDSIGNPEWEIMILLGAPE
jgi:hypothetical protein